MFGSSSSWSRYGYAIIAGISLWGCGANVPPPTQAYADFAVSQGRKLELDSLRAGHAYYVSQCGGCHGLRRPVKYAPEDWPKWLYEMRSRSDTALPHLQPIQDYLVTASAYLRDSTARARAAQKSAKN
jgi:mono/diheme cytochrome c family protein